MKDRIVFSCMVGVMMWVVLTSCQTVIGMGEALGNRMTALPPIFGLVGTIFCAAYIAFNVGRNVGRLENPPPAPPSISPVNAAEISINEAASKRVKR